MSEEKAQKCDKVRQNMTGNQERALAALLVSSSVREAAQSCGLTERTIHRYRKDPAFRAALAEERRLILSDRVLGLQTAAEDATEVFVNGLSFKDPSVQLRAATAIWRFMLKGLELEHAIDLEDLVARVEALELGE